MNDGMVIRQEAYKTLSVKNVRIRCQAHVWNREKNKLQTYRL